MTSPAVASRQDVPAAIIIGAGPAGLAVAACLRKAGVPFTILEQQQSVGASWRSHYNRLHLHTNKGTSALPFMPFPREYPRYPSRDQVVAYVEAYARRFAIEPHFNEEVVAARPHHDGWEVKTHTATYHAPHLVVATGLNREPVVPVWAAQDNYRGRIMHSRDYRDGSEFSGRRVLVVGIGNTGAEIALERFLVADDALDGQGNPRRTATSLPKGLHLCGFTVVPTGVLNQIGRDAKRIAAQIARERAP